MAAIHHYMAPQLTDKEKVPAAAVPGSDEACLAICFCVCYLRCLVPPTRVPGTGVAHGAVCLRAGYAMSSTDMMYANSVSHGWVLSLYGIQVSYAVHLCSRYAVSGTDLRSTASNTNPHYNFHRKCSALHLISLSACDRRRSV
eukprot:3901764-Rhodomonas_salina.4